MELPKRELPLALHTGKQSNFVPRSTPKNFVTQQKAWRKATESWVEATEQGKWEVLVVLKQTIAQDYARMHEKCLFAVY